MLGNNAADNERRLRNNKKDVEFILLALVSLRVGDDKDADENTTPHSQHRQI
jgi:hypothetical protein